VLKFEWLLSVALHWLISFVSDRSQYVANGLETSAKCALSSGVPQECSGAVLFASEVVAVSHPIPRGAISSVRRWPHDLLVTRSQGFWSHKQQTVAIVQPGADDGSGNHRLLAALKLIGWVTLDSTLTFNQQHESNAVSACRYHSVRCS